MVTTFLEGNLAVSMPCCMVTWHSIKQHLLPPLKSDIRSDLGDDSNTHLDLGEDAVVIFQLYSCADCPAVLCSQLVMDPGTEAWQASFCCACLSVVSPEHVTLPTDQSASCATEVCGQNIQGCLSKACSLCIS